VILPFGYLFLSSLWVERTGWLSPRDAEWTLTHYWNFVTDPFLLNTLLRSVVVGLISVIGAFLVGYPIAYYVSRSKSRLALVLSTIVIFPLLVNGVIRSYGWIVLLANSGIVNQGLLATGIVDEPVKLLFNNVGATIGLIHLYTPYMVLAVMAVLSGIDDSYEKAAQDLGSSPFQAFLLTTLPLSLPGILAGGLLVFARSITAFTTPFILGGGSFLMPVLIRQQFMTLFQWSEGAASAIILAVTALLVMRLSRLVPTARRGTAER
jgi:putative spermidine/putrescine transport system permease protein